GSGVPGGGAGRVGPEAHSGGGEISAGGAGGGGFDAAFRGGGGGPLDALRALFQRKALLARQSHLLDSPARTLGELSGPDAERVRALRAALGIDASDDAPAFVSGDGTPVSREDMRFRRMSALTALSLETNGGMCRDLLKVRYGEAV